MSSATLEREARAPRDPHPRGGHDLIDTKALGARLEKLAKANSGAEDALRKALAQALKAALAEGRARAEELLLADRNGRRCAERICRMEDEIIGLLFDIVRKHLYPSQNPSE